MVAIRSPPCLDDETCKLPAAFQRCRAALLAVAPFSPLLTPPLQLLLRYRTSAAGPCKILTHPRWGSHVYPATLFAIAPLHLLEDAFRAAAEAQAAAAGAAAATIGAADDEPSSCRGGGGGGGCC